MTIVDQAVLIRDTFQDWATSENEGKAFVASSLAHMWEIAFQRTNTLSVIVTYNGENLAGDFEISETHAVYYRNWVVAVTRGRGFASDPQRTLVEQVANAKPLLQLVDEAVDLARMIVTDPDTCPERLVFVRGVRTMQSSNPGLDGYLVEFSIANARDPVSSVPDTLAGIITEQGTA